MFKNIIAYRYKSMQRGAFLSGVLLGTLLRSNNLTKPDCVTFKGNDEYHVSYITFNSEVEIDLPYALDNNGLNDCLSCLALTDAESARRLDGRVSLNTILDRYDLYHIVLDTLTGEFVVSTIREKQKEFSERLILGKVQGFNKSVIDKIVSNLDNDSIQDQVENKLIERDAEGTDSELLYKLNEDAINIRQVIHCLHLDLFLAEVSSEILRILGKQLMEREGHYHARHNVSEVKDAYKRC